MGDAIQNAIIGGLFASFIVAIFLLPVAEYNATYGGNLDDTNLTALNKLTELQQESGDIKDLAIEASEVNTQESEVSFVSNAFAVSKAVFSGDTFTLIGSMLFDTIRFMGVSQILFTFLFSVLMVILSFAAVKKLLGR